jgi:hypothetical protein
MSALLLETLEGVLSGLSLPHANPPTPTFATHLEAKEREQRHGWTGGETQEQRKMS